MKSVALTALSALVLLNSCHSSRRPFVGTPTLKSLGSDAFVPTTCTPNAPGDPTPAIPKQTTVVRIKIPKNLSDLVDTSDPNELGRRVHYKVGETDVNVNDDLANTDPVNIGADQYNNNPFDIDFRTIATKKDWIRVRVILSDTKLKFLEANDLPGNISAPPGLKGMVYLYSPARGTDPKFPWICQTEYSNADPRNRPVTDNGNKSVMTFFIHRTVTGELPINFVIIPRPQPTATKPGFGLQTPIIIDPKIYNDG